MIEAKIFNRFIKNHFKFQSRLEDKKKQKQNFLKMENLIYCALPIIILIVYVFTLVNILKSSMTSKLKLLWILVCLCLPILGTILYFLIEKKQKRQ
ncbi:PLD nuclease N-terminal domain-containing protein [Kaistella sp.]|uniref:PLD nuclease N-terminal domain-containing protein n=1 Tax=Kaistella sp. TaxID=2782235 RepID=UPI003C6EE774